MNSTTQSEQECDRLQRLEREDRRRVWDSVVGAYITNETGKEPEPVSKGRGPASAMRRGSSDSISLINILADRLDRIERLALRLESETRLQERRNHVRFQRCLITATFLLTVVCGALGVGLLRH